MTEQRLKRGDQVKALDEEGTPLIEIESTGALGFKLKGRLTTRWWADRNKTWSSEKLDRLDATKEQFKQTATGR